MLADVLAEALYDFTWPLSPRDDFPTFAQLQPHQQDNYRVAALRTFERLARLGYETRKVYPDFVLEYLDG